VPSCQGICSGPPLHLIVKPTFTSAIMIPNELDTNKPKNNEMDPSKIVLAICEALRSGNIDVARAIAVNDYPMAYKKPHFPTLSKALGPDAFSIMSPAGHSLLKTEVFIRDGFVDRYTNRSLVFPGVLRLLSFELSAELPFDDHWNPALRHPMYWELYPTIDHVIPRPVDRHRNDASNLLSTIQQINTSKQTKSLSELGWCVHPPGNMKEWDGLLSWFLTYVQAHEYLRSIKPIRGWYQEALKALQRPSMSEWRNHLEVHLERRQ